MALHPSRTADFEGRRQRRRHRRNSAGGVMAGKGQCDLGFRNGQHFKADLGDHPKRAKTARHQLDQIIACDVFHHPPAIFQHPPGPIDKARAQEKIAACPHLHPARATDIGRHHTANGWGAFGAQDGAVIHRLEWQALAFGGKGCLDLGQGRAGAGHQGERAWLVIDDAIQPLG